MELNARIFIPATTEQFTFKLTEENGEKIFRRYKIIQHWEVLTDVRKDSSTEKNLNTYNRRDVLSIVFQPVTSEFIESNKKVFNELTEFKPNARLYYGTLNNKLIIIPQSHLTTQISRNRKDCEVQLIETYTLTEISEKELTKKRKSSTPSFVLKENNKYFYSQINPRIRLFSECLLGSHQCSHGSNDCNRLSAALDEEGGCARIRDTNPCIENYDFIQKGYQTFNTKANCFVVLSCEHFSPSEPRKTISPHKKQALLTGLAHYYYDTPSIF